MAFKKIPLFDELLSKRTRLELCDRRQLCDLVAASCTKSNICNYQYKNIAADKTDAMVFALNIRDDLLNTLMSALSKTGVVRFQFTLECTSSVNDGSGWESADEEIVSGDVTVDDSAALTDKYGDVMLNIIDRVCVQHDNVRRFVSVDGLLVKIVIGCKKVRLPRIVRGGGEASRGDQTGTKRPRLEICDPALFTIVENAFGSNIISYYYNNKNSESKDIFMFLVGLKPTISGLLGENLNNDHSLKFNLFLECTHERTVMTTDGDEYETRDTNFKTQQIAVYSVFDTDESLDQAIEKIVTEETEFVAKGSGWRLASIDGLFLRVTKYFALRGSSFIELPKSVVDKGAIINVKNLKDNECFRWAILSKYVTSPHPERLNSRYMSGELADKFDFSMVSFPTQIKDIAKFEKANKVSINVYSLKKRNNEVKPLRCCEREVENHFDLLYLKNETTSHYCYIKNFSRLISKQLGEKNAVIICKRCFKHYRQTDKEAVRKMEDHQQRCRFNLPAHCKMPSASQDGSPPTMKFKNYQHQDPVPVVAYADFECILHKPIPSVPTEATVAVEYHEPMSYCIYFVCEDTVDSEIKSAIPQEPIIYRGPDAAQNFTEQLVTVMKDIAELMKRNVRLHMTPDDLEAFRTTDRCEMCKTVFGVEDPATKKTPVKCQDHCHFTGKYRAALCAQCNLRRSTQNSVPVFFHNLAGYDAHFIVRELDYDNKRVTVIPKTSEKFTCFSKSIAKNLTVRFIDTIQFMAAGLSSLVDNLPRDKFHHLRKFFPHDLELVTRKGIFPYEYTDSWARLDETSLPPLSCFYSALMDQHISQDDYHHACAVWDHFNCMTLGDYSDLYLKTDVLLLADVFENFRQLCMQAYRLDAAHYVSAPGLAFDAMMFKTGVRLELLTDIDMYLFIEAGIRGGITTCVKKHAVANNPYHPASYNSNEPKKYIMYIDANNLYGWAMSRHLPISDFKWLDERERMDVLQKLSECPDDSPTGYIFEVDVEYPDSLHDLHNELPFLAVNDIPPGFRNRKLLTTLNPKRNYVCHYTTLRQAIKNGLTVSKVHKVLQFHQSPWLKSYIDMNTAMRQQAKNEFEKDFFKLMNNAVFGKSMENIRKRRNCKLVTDIQQLSRCVAKATFVDRTVYKPNLALVEVAKDTITLNKPIYVGLAILEISKTLMYGFFYEVLKPKYGSKISLLYMDTDSFILEVETDDMYQDLTDRDMKEYFDTSDYPVNHPAYSSVNRKVLGKFKDEAKSLSILEYIGLRPKMYTWRAAQPINNVTDGEGEVRKVKGVKKCTVKKRICFDDFRKCLNDPNSILVRSMRTFRSRHHHVSTLQIDKLSLVNFDDKRAAVDRINTMAWGHYRMPKDLLDGIGAD